MVRREDEMVLVANGSARTAPDGVRIVMPERIENALLGDSTAPQDMTWGEAERIHEGRIV